MKTVTVEKLAWMLIYGGLGVSFLGIFVKDREATLGWSLLALGALATVAGAVAVYLRSRMKGDT
jgi:hypothetical protein